MRSPAFCADEYFLLPFEASISILDLFQAKVATTEVATRRSRRFDHVAHEISFIQLDRTVGNSAYLAPKHQRQRSKKVPGKWVKHEQRILSV